MLCKKMIKSGHGIHPCGQCVFCRVNRKREWISRLLLEAASHPINQFWTLTYEDENLPTQTAPSPGILADSGRSCTGKDQEDSDHDFGRAGYSSDNGGVQHRQRSSELVAAASQPGTLFKPDLARFFKRVRKNHGDFRYYAVGEYGTLRGRPHYHVLAFGIELAPRTLQDTWKMGAVHIGDVESASINYCIEYALKSEKRDQLIDLRREPEFSVMSRTPGIGAYAYSEFRAAILESEPLPTGELLIPDSFRVLGREYAVPRFLRNMLEEEGFLYAPKATRRYLSDKEVLSSLLSRSKLAQAEFAKYEVLFDANRKEDYAQIAPVNIQVLNQKLRNSESRQRIFGKRHETL